MEAGDSTEEGTWGELGGGPIPNGSALAAAAAARDALAALTRIHSGSSRTVGVVDSAAAASVHSSPAVGEQQKVDVPSEGAVNCAANVDVLVEKSLPSAAQVPMRKDEVDESGESDGSPSKAVSGASKNT